MTTISRTARIWVNEVRNKRNTKETEEYFKEIFTEEEYDEFYLELMEQTKNVLDIALIEREVEVENPQCLYDAMDKYCNYFDHIDNIIDNVFNEVFQYVSGAFGMGCTDEEFETIRDYTGAFNWKELVSTYCGLNSGKKITDYPYMITCYTMALGKELPSVRKAVVPHPKQVCDILVENETNELVYNIINTSYYNGNMGSIIIKTSSPLSLIEYGFSNNEVEEIGKLSVGHTFTSHDYGVGCVVVRMA